MKYNELLKKYTEEYNNYIKMINTDNMTLDAILNMLDDIPSFNFTKVYNDLFKNFNIELKKINENLSRSIEKNENNLKENTKQTESNFKNEFNKNEKEELINKSDCCKSNEMNKDRLCSYKKEVIADTPNHKEFKVTFPNGVYKYKLLMK